MTQSAKLILFAWELGGNLGHITRDLPLARACRDAGYAVVMAVADLRSASAMFASEGFVLVPSPRLAPSRKRPAPPVNYADMLLHEGYDEPGALEGALRGWAGLIELAKASLIVFNHAPTALIAARAAKLPVMLTGTGFEIPPRISPLPSFRPWEDVSPGELSAAEQRVLLPINDALTRLRAAPLVSLADLFAPSRARLTTFAELDPFA